MAEKVATGARQRFFAENFAFASRGGESKPERERPPLHVLFPAVHGWHPEVVAAFAPKHDFVRRYEHCCPGAARDEESPRIRLTDVLFEPQR